MRHPAPIRNHGDAERIDKESVRGQFDARQERLDRSAQFRKTSAITPISNPQSPGIRLIHANSRTNGELSRQGIPETSENVRSG